MKYNIRDLIRFKSYSKLTSVGIVNKNRLVYKYIDIDTAVTCLRNNTLRFSIPTQWVDPYESRFYRADYSKVECAKMKKNMYACCVTQNKMSETAWKIYSYGKKKPCVKFSINIGLLRKYLDEYATKNSSELYEGEVFYGFSDKDLNGLHLQSSAFFHTFFDDFQLREFLNLMLLKRPAFYYEGEIRYILMGNKFDFRKRKIDVPIWWSMCLSSISVEKKTIEVMEKLQYALQENYALCKKEFALSYNPHVPIEEENIYRKFNRIVVGK